MEPVGSLFDGKEEIRVDHMKRGSVDGHSSSTLWRGRSSSEARTRRRTHHDRKKWLSSFAHASCGPTRAVEIGTTFHSVTTTMQVQDVRSTLAHFTSILCTYLGTVVHTIGLFLVETGSRS